MVDILLTIHYLVVARLSPTQPLWETRDNSYLRQLYVKDAKLLLVVEITQMIFVNASRVQIHVINRRIGPRAWRLWDFLLAHLWLDTVRECGRCWTGTMCLTSNENWILVVKACLQKNLTNNNTGLYFRVVTFTLGSGSVVWSPSHFFESVLLNRSF